MGPQDGRCVDPLTLSKPSCWSPAFNPPTPPPVVCVSCPGYVTEPPLAVECHLSRANIFRGALRVALGHVPVARHSTPQTRPAVYRPY